nr:reverse transcriptase domain-containing protein [Tanacetum cinerariifolium]
TPTRAVITVDAPTKHFTWTINNFSSSDSTKLYSGAFHVGGCIWRLLIFPKGNNVDDHLSLYLEVADSSSLPYGWSRYAQFSFFIVNNSNNQSSISKVGLHDSKKETGHAGLTYQDLQLDVRGCRDIYASLDKIVGVERHGGDGRYHAQCSCPEPITPLNEGTSNQNSKSIIEGHVSPLKKLLKEPRNRDLIKPMLLDFDDIQDVSDEEIEDGAKGKAKIGDEGLSKRRFGMLKACDKDPTEISKIVRRANETLPRFKKRWVSESNAIPNVAELMHISSFMSSHKYPELAKRFSDNVPKTRRVSAEGRTGAMGTTERPTERYPYGNNRHRQEHITAFRAPERNIPYAPPRRPGQEARWPRAVLTLDSLSSTPQEILATEHHLRLPQPAPLVGVPNKENVNKYCDCNNEKGHNTNDCFHLKQQLELALESGKLNHLVKDARQRGRGDEKWTNAPIIFPPVLARDLSEEALVVEAEVEGYLVRRIYIDERASVEIMFEHCFNMLHPSIRSRLVETQTTVSGFSGEQVKPLGKIELDVCFGRSGRCRRAILKFTIIPTPSRYNIILGRPGFETTQGRPIHHPWHDEIPNPLGVATLVSQTPVVFECRREGKKQKNQHEAKPKKCSVGVEEGKFLGYMVTSEGIRANPAKTKDLAEMQSPRSWGEMKSLAGKLAPLNRFLSRSTEKSLPFFETLKDITKENKHDYRWTEKAENAFQELKKMILDLPALTTSSPKETLFVYLAASKEAVSALLLVVRQGKRHPVHYVSRTLHDAERNYAPLEKMALALRHASRRLRRYFEAH